MENIENSLDLHSSPNVSATDGKSSSYFKISALSPLNSPKKLRRTSAIKLKNLEQSNSKFSLKPKNKLSASQILKRKKIKKLKSRLESNKKLETTQIRGKIHQLVKRIKTGFEENKETKQESTAEISYFPMKTSKSIQIIDLIIAICLVFSTVSSFVHSKMFLREVDLLFTDQTELEIKQLEEFTPSSTILALRWISLTFNLIAPVLYLFRARIEREFSWTMVSAYLILCFPSNMPFRMGICVFDCAGTINLFFWASLVDILSLLKPLLLVDLAVHASKAKDSLQLKQKYKLTNFRLFAFKLALKRCSLKILLLIVVYLMILAVNTISIVEHFEVTDTKVSVRTNNSVSWTALWAVFRLGYGSSEVNTALGRAFLALSSVSGVLVTALIIFTLFKLFSLKKEEECFYATVKTEENKKSQVQTAISLIKHTLMLSKSKTSLTNTFILLTKLRVEAKELDLLKSEAKTLNQNIYLKTNNLLEKAPSYSHKLETINTNLRVAAATLSKLNTDTNHIKYRLACCLDQIESTGNLFLAK